MFELNIHKSSLWVERNWRLRFSDCQNLTSIVLPPDLTEISDGMFSGAGLTSLDIPCGVTRIGYSAFSHCKGLTSVRLPNSVIETTGFLLRFVKSNVNSAAF